MVADREAASIALPVAPPGARGQGQRPPLQFLTKYAYAYQELRQRILDGHLAPGCRLMLRPLADELGLSVQPVRDALKMLEADGLVESQSHRGATVTHISGNRILELISTRMWLEVLAVQEAAGRHDQESLARAERELEAAARSMTARDGLVYSRANRRLHEALEAPASDTVRGLITEGWDQLWQARRSSSLFSLASDASASAQREHEAIFVAIRDGDEAAAVAAMARHRDKTLREWREAVVNL
jgi:DNA-binding GntR family transcriptional regulator